MNYFIQAINFINSIIIILINHDIISFLISKYLIFKFHYFVILQSSFLQFI